MLSTLRLRSLDLALAFVVRKSVRAGTRRSTPSTASIAESTAGSEGRRAVQTPQAVPAPPADGAGGPQLEPQGFTYDPAGRRDPFVSLLRRGADPQNPTSGSRPAGLAGSRRARSRSKERSRARAARSASSWDLTTRPTSSDQATGCSTARIRAITPGQHGDHPAGERPSLARERARGAEGAPTDDEEAK